MVYHMAFETCKSFKGDILLHVRVTHDDVCRKIQKNVKSDKKDLKMVLKICKERPVL